jgi:hypothetical protein
LRNALTPPIYLLMNSMTALLPPGRATPAQLKRAAGSQSLDVLMNALVGYSAHEVDSMVQGKNLLHMAAWKGSIEIIGHLLDFGCDINTISEGEYSYGKTPIFFALTQSRNDVVSYLLDRGAKVKIVNNKGQSVLSIAISHLNSDNIQKIVEQERLEQGEWVNYRATHSDGLEYGDLDPRFLDRPLRSQDVVTDFCVNPTTKQSRKGAFLRRNFDRVSTTTQPKQISLCTRQNKQRTRPTLSPQEEHSLARTWLAIDERKLCPSALLTLVSLSAKQQKAWVTTAADKIRSNFSMHEIDTLFQSLTTSCEREEKLIKRLYLQIQSPTEANGAHGACKTRKLSDSPPSLTDGRWKEACISVHDLSIAVLEEHQVPILALPCMPSWVGSQTALDSLAAHLELEPVVAFDSEWFTNAIDERMSVSTIQLATRESAWVVDLMVEEPVYRRACQMLLIRLFESKIMLGFACHRDLHMLSDWCDHKLSDTNCLDLQLLWKDCKSPPGLASCAHEVTSKPLSKSQQCSDWSRRPLTDAQLQYAGLDAAILLYILSEKYKCELA